MLHTSSRRHNCVYKGVQITVKRFGQPVGVEIRKNESNYYFSHAEVHDYEKTGSISDTSSTPDELAELLGLLLHLIEHGGPIEPAIDWVIEHPVNDDMYGYPLFRQSLMEALEKGETNGSEDS